jgi:hypothetical protein
MIDHRVLCSLQDHLITGMRDLDHPVHAGAENTDSDEPGDLTIDVYCEELYRFKSSSSFIESLKRDKEICQFMVCTPQ